ncbi:hypothetical protein PENTCL1PPCAC_15604, partial [Pristionchus entomophagus]
IPEVRETLKRFNPSDEEFLALVALTFWNLENTDVGEEAMRVRDHYRDVLLKELHVIYRSSLQTYNCAVRLGELMMLQQTLEKSNAMVEHLEVFRLFNVLPDDNFVYAIQRED